MPSYSELARSQYWSAGAALAAAFAIHHNANRPLAVHPHGECVQAGISKKFPYVLHGHENGQMIFNYYKDNGFTPIAAAAQAGNDWAESNDIPTENSVSGLGVSQWTSTGGRLQRLETLASDEGRSPGDLGVQLQFSCIEYRQTYPKVLGALQGAKTVEAATSIVMYGYEGTSSNYAGRLAAAHTMYSWYVGQQNHT